MPKELLHEPREFTLKANETEPYNLRSPQRIITVAVFCHDRPGNQHRAQLRCWIDDTDLGTKDVDKNGSRLDFDTDVVGQRVYLQSLRDATVVQVVTIYGI